MTLCDVRASDGLVLEARRWDAEGTPKAVVQIAHGAAEHLGRYERFARVLNAHGYAAIGADHRGHGTNSLGRLGSFGPRGFTGVVEDMAAVAETAKALWPGLPLLLFGHSMGSFASQAFLAGHADRIDGLILSGTAAVDQLLANADLAAGLTSANAAFEPSRTQCDWLSRDAGEVDAYIADPLCGFELELASMATMPAAVIGVRTPERLAEAVRRRIPVLVISGECDPIVGDGQRYARMVVDDYISAGLDVLHRIYPGGRHEMLNETNRDEVMRHVVQWLDEQIG